jgi:acetyl esterase/lipase
VTQWSIPSEEPITSTNTTTLIKNVQYSAPNGQPLHLDILHPNPLPDEPMPAVIEIHGGAFVEGEPDVEQNRLLSEDGFFTASIQYRLSGEAQFPAQIHDCKAAVRWVRANADKYHVDAARVGVWGGSAGGTLAALVGTSGDLPELEGDGGSPGYSTTVQAVIDECGLTDMREQLRFGHPDNIWWVEQLFGGPLEDRSELVRLANPITHIRSDCPPFLIVHGEADDVVPIQNSELLYEALKSAGCDVTFIRIPNAGHGFAETWDRSAEQVRLEFFRRHLARQPES